MERTKDVMSKIKTLGLALVVVLVAGVVGAASASAAPVWEEENFSLWSEIKVKAKIIGTGIVTLTDEGTGLEMECEGPNGGIAGPGSSGEITELTTNKCFVLKGTCASAGATALNLPWKTTLALVGGEVRETIENGGKGEPGWNFVCGGSVVDTCTGTMSTAMVNFVPLGKVEALYDAKTAKTNCSAGGAGKGKILGFNIIVLENGKKLRV
jgi:hypothetical protein